jgi:hypothetical protein
LSPNNPIITYTPRPDAMLEGELNSLAAVYAYLLKNRKAAEPAPDAAARVKHNEEVSDVNPQN